MIFSTIEEGSLAWRVTEMVSELVRLGRMSQTEARVVYDLLWHPELPDFFRERQSAPGVAKANDH